MAATALSTDPAYSPIVPSLLDRGMVYAIAHIRGGQEMGRAWYDDGHLLNKKNTFTDFIDVTRYLVANGYAAKDRVAASGGSAGGLLMGAIANMAPQDYRVIIAQVPFVDVVTTMLDASIPLTTNEFDEWGNPAERQILRLHAELLALRPDQRARPIRRCSSAPACGTARSSITSRPNMSRRLRAIEDRHAIRWCSGSTWRRATAASRAGSSNIARGPNITPSCSSSWGSASAKHQHRPLLRAAANGAGKRSGSEA